MKNGSSVGDRMEARILLSIGDDRVANTLYKSLKPEIEADIRETRGNIMREGNEILIRFTSNNYSSLRAALNATFRLTVMILQALNELM